ncbi:MAG: 50S ribosomal protein L18 [Candidatus Omnitrophota bacterium]|nr:50S ribosomal protein L18 [Candidatus Omnitrophota bacterium]
MKNMKEAARIKRHKRLRQKIAGSVEQPRLAIHRSMANLYVQFIDDINGRTLCSISTLSGSKTKEKAKYGGNIKAAETLGEAAARLAKSKGISKVVFDRSGYVYHGRIKAFAESARKNGLSF